VTEQAAAIMRLTQIECYSKDHQNHAAVVPEKSPLWQSSVSVELGIMGGTRTL
jgi:hypothetical protein